MENRNGNEYSENRNRSGCCNNYSYIYGVSSNC